MVAIPMKRRVLKDLLGVVDGQSTNPTLIAKKS
jgi:hypothetical protein